MKREPDLNWVVEHDDLPADDPHALPQGGRPSGTRRLPGWASLAALAVAIGLGVLAWLWQVGGQVGSLPPADPLDDQLQAAVDLELKALASNDREILEYIHDRDLEQLPVPEEISVLAIHRPDENNAWVEVQLDWQQRAYRMVWFYRRDAERWRHTNWATIDEGDVLSITSPHVAMRSPELHREQAEATLEAAEALLVSLCVTVNCPPIHLQMWMDQTPDYYVHSPAPFFYRFPSPLQVRWQLDGRPDPLVMASFGRHLVYDILVNSARDRLTPENETALALAGYWLVHSMLEVDSFPGTYWLDGVATRDGTPAVAAFIGELSAGVPPQMALRNVLPAETLEWLSSEPDYFSWLALVQDPGNQIRPALDDVDPLSLPWGAPLQVSFDWLGKPWATDDTGDGNVAPPIVALRQRPGWLVAVLEPDSLWGAALFFQGTGGNWQLARPDSSLMGPLHQRSGQLSLIYWEWDGAQVDSLLSVLYLLGSTSRVNFGVGITQTVPVMVLAPPEAVALPELPAQVHVGSPALESLLERPIEIRQEELLWQLFWAQVANELERPGAAGSPLHYGLVAWQMGQFHLDYGGPQAPDLFSRLPVWQAPGTPGDPGWHTLDELWEAPAGSLNVDLAIMATQIVRYLVAERGIAHVATLVATLNTAGSMEEWVQQVSGQDVDTFERAWHSWMTDLP